ncbi:MAG: DUF1294 domain-containing protein [Clostridiales bacterium]|nr:DUF1294 domain-containing protein [Clostridiales bacterium]
MPSLQKIQIIYYIAINLTLFLSMGIDKLKAIHRQWRIPEVTLFAFALMGGSIGGFIGMFVFHHKTRKFYFYLVYAFGLLAHTFCWFLFMKV